MIHAVNYIPPRMPFLEHEQILHYDTFGDRGVHGDSDALARIRVDKVRHLEQAINNLRKTVLALGTRTVLVLSS